MGDGLGGAAIVAGNHCHFQPQPVQGGNSLLRGVLDGIGYCNDCGQLAVDGRIKRRLAFIGQLGGRVRKGTDVEAEFEHIAVGTDFDAGAFDLCLHAKTRD